MGDVLQLDGRAARRKPVNLPAWYERSPGQLVPCTLLNMTDEGAKLEIGAGVELPGRFTLWLTHDGHLRRGCRVIWRDGPSAGVRFFEVPPPPAAA